MYVIKNAFIVTMDANKRLIRNGNIWIEDDRIVKIGPAADVGLPVDEYESMDASGMIAIPGFVSTHNT